MAIRPRRLRIPPPVEDPNVSGWMRDVVEAFNGLPFSVFSTSDGPNSSNVTAPQGFLGFEIGSSSTKIWLKEGSGSTRWSAFSTVGY